MTPQGNCVERRWDECRRKSFHADKEGCDWKSMSWICLDAACFLVVFIYISNPMSYIDSKQSA